MVEQPPHVRGVIPRRPLPISNLTAARGDGSTATLNLGDSMANHIHDPEDSNFEITSKRRKGFPSETRVKRRDRIIRGTKQLLEKLGRNDLCPCGSGRSF